MDDVGGDLGEWGEHEGAFLDAVVRDGEVRLIYSGLAPEQNVDIQFAWAVLDGAHPTVLGFDRRNVPEHLQWGERGLHGEAGV